MGRNKKNTAATTNDNLTTLKIGSRVRCTDDGVQGRITWANGVSVKIKWDDGEQVTWKRDSLATRPIEILDADGDEQPAAPAVTDAAVETTSASEADQPTAPQAPAAAEPVATTEQPQTEPEITPAPAEPTATEPVPVPEATGEQATPSTDAEAAPTAAKPKRQRKAAAEPKEKKISALDAAAKVLAEAGQALNAQEMIKAMADKGYWTSPGGKTPAATIYAAISSEIKKKGPASRFQKTERGKFARRPAA